ncbi:leucine-rich repeat protein [Lachnoclostridium sp. MSJ-17]|uniref:leucine-rich repeat protein n=1 Tax=Lachnoclostridium sp. MSJ-17 TaxID=2841516 RepID=UPI001C10C021|nr:leucine-rich repeat protein [Lachnoclostridium sp. MSJ-17]MBU5462391.1 leucine-rich repeat protein [Lachnoclostridium sp. MSJ-17]
MNKIKKTVLPFTIAAMLCIMSVFQINAETIYEVNGYSYTIINNSSVSLYAWDYSSDTLVVPDSFANRYVTSISGRAFKNDSNMTAVDFSNAIHLELISVEAFYNSGLSSKVTLTPSITTIGVRAFENCQFLPEIDIQSSAKTIPEQCFNSCASLSKVTLNDSVESINRLAFANCPMLEYIVIPQSVTSISTIAFYNSPNLTLGVWYGSYAHQYAKDNNIPFKILDEFKLGDVDTDGYVNINDVTSIQRNLAELEDFNELQELAADANRDGVLDISDATAIQMFLAEYEIPYPIGEIITQ